MAVKILSVDDEVDLELLLTQYFRRKIRKGEYEFLFAHNGLEALKMLQKTPDIDIILSDINMPEMDGLTMLSKINEIRNPALKCIMVSAYGDMGNIRTAMNNGAFDFATKPIDLEDLEKSIENAIAQINYIKQTQKEHNQLVDIQNDLELAHNIQQSILPVDFNLPFKQGTDYDLFASMHAAKDVGGDFYDFFRIDDKHLGFTMADVSGKGVPAALFMAVSRTMIKALGLNEISSARCMEMANDMLCEESVDSMFVTVFYGVLDLETGQIDYTNAGHNTPYVVHPDGSIEALPIAGNLIVGAVSGVPYKNGTLMLKPGDKLVMYTDGVTEAMDPQFVELGDARFEELLKKQGSTDCKQTTEAIAQYVKEWANGAPQSDDVTIMVLGKK